MLRQWNIWPFLVGLSGFAAVAMGAAGAHLVTDAGAAALVEKASLYQLIHTLVLLWLCARPGRASQLACIVFLAGILLFSGSLYLKGFGFADAAPLAPIGGMLLMTGWLLTAASRT